MNQKIIAAIVSIIVIAGSFYGGMLFGQSKSSARPGGGDFANFSPQERQARFGVGNQAGAKGLRGNGGATTGEIIFKDDKSVTVKLSDGGSKIIFYSASTEVGQFVSASSTDLVVGKTVMVNGQANADGSIAAQSIQIRPAELVPPQN